MHRVEHHKGARRAPIAVAVFGVLAIVVWVWYARRPVVGREYQHLGGMYRLQFSADGRYLLAHGMGLMQVWDLLSNQAVVVADTPRADFPVVLLPDGQPFTEADWGSFEPRPMTRPQDRSVVGPWPLFISADGRQIAGIPTDDSIVVLRGEGYAQEAHIGGLPGFRPSAVKFSRDGKYVTAGSPMGRIVTWQISTGQRVHDWSTAITDTPMWVDVSEDGRTAVFGHGWSVTVANADAPASPRQLHVFSSNTSAVAFLDAAHLIAAAGHSAGELLVWDASTLQLVKRFNGHSARVFSIAMSPQGSLIASGDSHGRVLVWRVGLDTKKRQDEASGRENVSE